MNQNAYDAIEALWALTVKTRALCPHADDSAVGLTQYVSPDWYQARGVVYFVRPAKALSAHDVRELNEIGSFVNRSFIVSMVAILEEYGVVPCKASPDSSKRGGDHVQLTKWLRNRFAHGEWEYDADDKKHVETRLLLEALFPEECAKEVGFVTSIDKILEPLKEGVLTYIRAAE